MVFVALLLMAVGVAVSLFGYKLFRILLPIVGLVAGTVIGFTGFQGIFGTGTISTTVAVFVAVAVGLLLAVLSFAFFEIAVIVLSGLLGAALLSYLGIALGLGSDGFIVLLLSIAGFVLGFVLASTGTFGANLVVTLTAMIGVAMILAGLFLVAGHLTLDQLGSEGVVKAALRVIDQSLLWLFVWLAGSIIARQAQIRMLVVSLLGNAYEYNAEVVKK